MYVGYGGLYINYYNFLSFEIYNIGGIFVEYLIGIVFAGTFLCFTSPPLSSVRGLSCWLSASVACLTLTRDRGWCAGFSGD